MKRVPFFYDVTLRDGNQALKKPWTEKEKRVIFNQLIALGVQGIEIGFPASDEMDFHSCQNLARLAPKNVVVSVLARAVKNDIEKAVEAVKDAYRPRIHTFIAMNPLGLKYVLNKDIDEVTNIAVEAVSYAKSLLPRAEVEFSVEHFGDCRENLPAVINAIEKVVDAGADVINLPNTVERFRPRDFTNMVKTVSDRIGDKAIISVHCHNDLGMATATTVESFFSGATQLETTLNGLGERAGNTSMFEVAVALHNSDEKVQLRMDKFYESALLVSEMSRVPIWEKTPVIGSDVLAHRSGIHQDGSNKTKGLSKGQYIAFNPELVGRYDGEHIGFTSQSGRSALISSYGEMGYPITVQEAIVLLPIAKKIAEAEGELSVAQLDQLYRQSFCDVKGPYEYVSFDVTAENRYYLTYKRKGVQKSIMSEGDGPVEGCINALQKTGLDISVTEYEQRMLNKEAKESSEALTSMKMAKGERQVICRAIDRSTTQSNVRAIFNGLNQLVKQRRD